MNSNDINQQDPNENSYANSGSNADPASSVYEKEKQEASVGIPVTDSDVLNPKAGGGWKKWIIIIIVVAVLVLAAAGAYAAWYFQIRQTPQEVMMQGLQNMNNMKSAWVEGDIQISSKAGSSFSGNIDYNGKFDAINGTDLKDLKSDFEFTMNFTSGDGQSFVLGSKLRTLDGTAYFKITKMPPVMAFFGLNTRDWMRIDDLQEKLEEAGGVANTDRSETQASSSVVNLSEEDKAELRKILKEHKNAFQVTEPFPKETLDGKEVRHFRFTLDEKEIADLLVDVLEYQRKNNLIPENASGATDEELIQSVEEVAETIQNAQGEIWVGTEDQIARKARLSLDVKKGGETLHVEVNIHYSHIGEPITVQKPEQSVSMNQYFEMLRGAANNSSMLQNETVDAEGMDI